MSKFMDQDFLLSTATAKHLFHDYAENMPVLDYHCHISPQEIAEDRQFDNISQVWLGGDHYKWRLMRANGVPEAYITGDAPDREKFQKYAETMEKCIGNPVYIWTHLELQRFFGYYGALNSRTAEEVWNLCNAKLRDPAFSVRNLIKMSNVTLICTTDDPIDDLKWHKFIKEDPTFDVQVLPAWRPDKTTNIEKPEWAEYIARLAAAADDEICCFGCIKRAIRKRLEYFAAAGASVSDHGLDYVVYEPATDEEVNDIVKRRLAGETLTAKEVAQYKTAFMLFLGREYHRLNWVMQLHYSCRRNNNSVMFGKLGPDTGYDAVSDFGPVDQTAMFLDALASTGELPKTILYSLNGADNNKLVSLMGCFQNEEAVGKMQHGSAWWFNDTLPGMRDQMTTLANGGVFGNFIGMLTDSRSFLSYPRHELFRRLVCQMIGEWVENGEYPDDEEALKAIVQGISYNNAVRYFGFNL